MTEITRQAPAGSDRRHDSNIARAANSNLCPRHGCSLEFQRHHCSLGGTGEEHVDHWRCPHYVTLAQSRRYYCSYSEYL